MKIKYYILIFFLLSFFKTFSQNRTEQLVYQPGIEKLTLYSGVDFVDRDLVKKRALVKPENPLPEGVHSPNVNIHSYIAISDYSSTSNLDLNLKGDVSLPWVNVHGDDSYTKNTVEKQNSFKLVIVVQSIYNPDLVDDNAKLMPEAEKLKKNQSEFIKTFGTYFCSAVYKGHYLIINVSLSNIYSSSLENLFHSGKIAIPLEIVDINIQDKIKHDVQNIANNFSSTINISTIGGPDISAYSSIVDALKPTSDFTSIYGFLTNIIKQFEYKNAKTIQVTLSDYSTWGIEAPFIVRNDIRTNQEQIFDLSKKISKQMSNISSMYKDDFISKFYTNSQLVLARQVYGKLNELQDNLYEALQQLDYGNLSYFNKKVIYEKEFFDLRKKLPEVLDYLASKGNQSVGSVLLNGDNRDAAYIKNLISNIYIYNSFNLIPAFFNLKSIDVYNYRTKSSVGSINLVNLNPNLFSSDTTLNYFELSKLFNSTDLDFFANGISRDVFRNFVTFSRANFNILAEDELLYTIKLVDKSDRAFIYPFMKVKMTVNPNNVEASEVLQTNCCYYVDDYESSDNTPSPETVRLNLSALSVPLSDSLIIEVRTSNLNLNNALTKDKDFTLHLSKDDLSRIAENPILAINLKKYNSQIDQLVISWYSKKNNGTKDSNISRLSVPWKRKICSQIIHLN